MAKLTLTIKSSYVPTWGLFEGVREVLQNAQDAVTMYGAELKIEYFPRTTRLVVTSTGASIDARALLLGQSDKVGRSDAIGGKAEGLKLALVALTRGGNDIRIETADEVWTCSFEKSPEFGGEELLTVWTRKVQATENRVAVTICDVSARDWKEIAQKFLFVVKPAGKVVETAYGKVLFDPQYAGKIFVKGIFVQTLDKVGYGYDLANVSVDRDRKMVSIWDAEIHCSLALNDAARSDADAQRGLYENLRAGRRDGSGASACSFNDSTIAAIDALFADEFGPEAYPVANENEATELRSRGGRAVIAPKALLEAVRQKRGGLHAQIAKLAEAVTGHVEIEALSCDERAVYDRAHDQLNRVLDHADRVRASIATFADENKDGTFSPRTGEIKIAARLLGNTSAFLAALVHEAAHALSGAPDGALEHVAMIEKLWEKIHANMQARIFALAADVDSVDA